MPRSRRRPDTASRLTARSSGGVAIVAALIVALLGLAAAPPAAAHGELLSSDPSEGALMEALPSRAFLTFSDPVESIREITVTGPDGSVTNGDPTTNGPEVRQNLWSGPDGAYTMTYFVVSSDGHDIRGEVSFEIGELSARGADQGSVDEQASGVGGGSQDGGFRVLVPVTVVVLAGAAALALTRLRSRRRPV